jgi:hypothetical protein
MAASEGSATGLTLVTTEDDPMSLPSLVRTDCALEN